jgi:predicted NBD/HSP70 family sugar kinase
VIIQLNHDAHLYVASGGTLVTGRSGRTGDLAHLPVPGNDRRCDCGKSGCLRTVSSGHAVVTAYEELTGERLPAAVDVIERVASRDPHAITAVRRSVDWLAVALAPLLGVLAPDRILLTGAVGAADSGGVAYLTEAIREAVERPDLPIEVVHPGFSTVDLTRALTA